jgi:hypothetical protein
VMGEASMEGKQPGRLLHRGGTSAESSHNTGPKHWKGAGLSQNS